MTVHHLRRDQLLLALNVDSIGHLVEALTLLEKRRRLDGLRLTTELAGLKSELLQMSKEQQHRRRVA